MYTEFSMQKKDLLLDHTEITLNLLLPSRINPSLSAYRQLYGSFDFNLTPIATPGTIIMVHYKPHNRGNWHPNDYEGCYAHPEMLQYHCLMS